MRHIFCAIILASGSMLAACAGGKPSAAPPSVGHFTPAPYPYLSSVTQGQAWEKAIADRVKPCWNFPPIPNGVAPRDLDVRVYLNPDGTVIRSELVNPAILNRSPEARAAALAALRPAVNPTCNTPLPQPIAYKEIILVFDPKDMGQ